MNGLQMNVLVSLLLATSVAGSPPGKFMLKRTRSTFRSLPKHPGFQEAKNVCLQVANPCSSALAQGADDESNKYLATQLRLQAMPADFKGSLHQSALLITRPEDVQFDRRNTFFQKHSEELSESMLPMFDFLHDLHQKVGKEVFSAVLMPQVPSAQHFVDTASFDADVLDSLLEVSGSKGNTKKMFCEDMKKEDMVCFNRLVHYRHDHSHSEKSHLTSKVAAMALREHVGVSTTQSAGRQAVLVLRKDHMGWTNFVEVEQKLREVLSQKCWNLKVVEPSDSPAEHAIDSLKDADLVVANHGAHNEHMIWMPRSAAFIEDKNCKCSKYGHEKLAAQEGLHYAATFSATEDAHECALQQKGLGICTQDKPRVVDFEAEMLPTVTNMLELLEKTRSEPAAGYSATGQADCGL